MHRVLIAVVVRLEVVPTHVITQISLQTNIESGYITFKNSNEIADTVSSIPIENLLVETDSPYLAPMPYRGKSNEPSYIVHTVEKLSQIKNVSKEYVMSSTTNNFKRLFKLI